MSFLERLRRLMQGEEPPVVSEGKEGECPSASTRHITCAQALEKINEYLDGELDDVTHEEVAEHFRVCKRCFPHLRLEERFREALRRSQEGEACPDHVKTQVLELLAAEAGDLD